jgi:hypothetical protein
MLLKAIALIMLSFLLYKMTKMRQSKLRKKKKKKQVDIEVELEQQKLKPAYNTVSLSEKHMWVRGISAEIKIMLKGQPKIWYLASITGIVLTLFLEMSVVHTMVIPLLMLWLVNVFSRLGNREHKHDMLKIIATIPGGKLKQIIYSLIAGLLIALLLTLPIIIRLFAAGHFIGVFAVLSGVIFVPSFAMFLGEFTKTNRMFEMLFIIMTYAIVNGVPVAMYMGYPTRPSVLQAVAYLIAGIIFAAFAVFKRKTFGVL